jgi:hypothetical protein
MLPIAAQCTLIEASISTWQRKDLSDPRTGGAIQRHFSMRYIMGRLELLAPQPSSDSHSFGVDLPGLTGIQID